jgi:hypothetical protein
MLIVATYPMLSALGIKPMQGLPAPAPAIQDARLCGSCHTIILPVYDKDGNQVMENGQPKFSTSKRHSQNGSIANS